MPTHLVLVVFTNDANLVWILYATPSRTWVIMETSKNENVCVMRTPCLGIFGLEFLGNPKCQNASQVPTSATCLSSPIIVCPFTMQLGVADSAIANRKSAGSPEIAAPMPLRTVSLRLVLELVFKSVLIFTQQDWFSHLLFVKTGLVKQWDPFLRLVSPNLFAG